jgi:hypothetical protein
VFPFVGFKIRESNPQGFFGLSFSDRPRFIVWVNHYSEFGPIVFEQRLTMDSA